MDKKVFWITETAAMLALLIALQAITKPLGQLVTGSFVNSILALTALFVGLSGGITVALISPVCAFLFGIAPNFITVLPIMAGNVCFVVLLYLIAGKRNTPIWQQGIGLVAAASAKFIVLYLLVAKVVCGIAYPSLVGKKIGSVVVMAPTMLQKLPAMFTWPQLFTALIGGSVALVITPVLRRALPK